MNTTEEKSFEVHQSILYNEDHIEKPSEKIHRNDGPTKDTTKESIKNEKSLIEVMTDDKGDAIYITISLTGWISLNILVVKSCFANNRNLATIAVQEYIMKFLHREKNESSKRFVIDVENMINKIIDSDRKYCRCAKGDCTNCVCKKAGLACVPNKCHKLNNLLCKNIALEV